MVLFVLVLISFGLVGAAYVTDPFSRLSIIRRPFIVHIAKDRFITTNNNHRLIVKQQWYWRFFAIVKCGIHIVSSRYVYSPRAKSTDVHGIIADIHHYRFNPKKLLLTSGDHFSALFVRNLGVFYYPMLDGSISSSKHDWQNRQIVYLQTVAYALGVFAKSPVPTTTIVSTGAYTATCVNFYAYPSDTVYGILYALAALLGKQEALPGEAYQVQKLALDTTAAAHELLDTYSEILRQLYYHYQETVFSTQSGLVKTDIHLSGAKDITRRSSAFYDNVVYWKTTELAMQLGIIPQDRRFLRDLKKRILKTFWLPEKGYFLEDLSEESKRNAYYSSDWLIVLATGFLHPAKPSELPYFERIVTYIREQHIDEPFAIKYQQATRAHRQFLFVRLAVASYGGDAIWSFWGMEYIKLLLLLHKHTGDKNYLHAADRHMKEYERVMVRDHGFPEVFDKRGKFLETRVYRSVRQTGWVIGFEQARAMRQTIKRQTTASRKHK